MNWPSQYQPWLAPPQQSQVTTSAPLALLNAYSSRHLWLSSLRNVIVAACAAVVGATTRAAAETTTATRRRIRMARVFMAFPDLDVDGFRRGNSFRSPGTFRN